MSASDKLDRRWAAGAALQKRVSEAIQRLDVDNVRQIGALLIDELGYLGDHVPEERESVEPFACSGETYHYCSFSTQHDPGCKAVGGDGKLQNGFQAARSCEPDCGKTDAQPWCQSCGFDCPTCEMVDNLLGILARAENSHPGSDA